jgi:hypothetical protein
MKTNYKEIWKMYVYTELAEQRANNQPSLFKGHKAGEVVMFAGEPIENTPRILKAWLEKGFIKEI